MKKTIFKCDNCRKETSEGEGYKFPYEKGWVYLYKIEFKRKSGKSTNLRDRHFCSKKCMNEWINSQIGVDNGST